MTVLRAVYHYLGRFLLFWRDFLIGDDWWGAGIILVGLGITYLVARLGSPAYYVPVVFVLISLGQHLWRARRQTARAAGESGTGPAGRGGPPERR